jgi:hypothetical protein
VAENLKFYVTLVIEVFPWAVRKTRKERKVRVLLNHASFVERIDSQIKRIFQSVNAKGRKERKLFLFAQHIISF